MNSLCLGYVFGLIFVLGSEEKTNVGAEVGKRDKAVIPLRKHFNSDSYGYTSTIMPEPEFLGSIGSHKTIAGRDAVLKCVVENLGEYKVAWMNVGTKDILSIGVHVIARNERILVTTIGFISWFLHIKNVTEEDIGYYMCQINTQPMKSQVGYLNVVVPPEFVSNMSNRNVTIMENSNVTMSCKATGNPPPVIKWKREDGQPFLINGELVREYENDELLLTGVTRLHMAAYLCLASNQVPPPISRRIYLNVMFPPLIWILNQLVGAPENISISLECHTEAHPTSLNFWLKSGERIQYKNERYHNYLTRNSYKAIMKLTISNLQFDDYGSYKCVAENEIGVTEGAITLYRLKLPSPPPPKPVTQEITTFLPRIVTAVPTSENKFMMTEIERREYTNTARKQEKYGTVVIYRNGKDENKAIVISPVLVHVILPILTLLWTIYWRNRR